MTLTLFVHPLNKMIVRVFFAAFLAVSVIADAPTGSPTSSPTLFPSVSPTPPTQTPSLSPTFAVGQESIVCPTQTTPVTGYDSGGVIYAGATPDGSDFVGAVSGKVVIAGRGVSTVLVYQSDSLQTVVAQFATSYPNTGQIGGTGLAPNMTWTGVNYGFTNSSAILKFALYAPKEVTAAYSVLGNLKLKSLKIIDLTKPVFGSEIDTGLVDADIQNHIRVTPAYFIIGLSASNVISISRSTSSIVDGKPFTTFSKVALSTTIGKTPATVLTTPFESSMDAKGLIVMIYPTSSTQLAVSMYDTSKFTNKIEHKTFINYLPGAGAAQKIAIATPLAKYFLVAYVDNSSPRQIVTVFTKDAFATFSGPTPIGITTYPSVPAGLFITWTSNNTINIWETVSPNAWARPWVWNFTQVAKASTSPSKFENATLGAWASQAILMFKGSAWTFLSLSTQTSYGYNIATDTVSSPKNIQASSCLVYTFLNTTSAGSILSGGVISFALLILSLFVSL